MVFGPDAKCAHTKKKKIKIKTYTIILPIETNVLN